MLSDKCGHMGQFVYRVRDGAQKYSNAAQKTHLPWSKSTLSTNSNPIIHVKKLISCTLLMHVSQKPPD